MQVALVVLDSVRKDHLGPYGGATPTPNIDALADRGVTFTNCIAGAPWTPPSHATMFTGQYPSAHGVRADDLTFPEEGYYLPEALSDAGITTQGIGAEPWLSRRQGFDRGFDRFHDTGGHSWRHYLPLWRALAGYGVERVRGRLGTDRGAARLSVHLFRQWARVAESFSFVNISVAHSPYRPPDPFRERVGAPAEGDEEGFAETQEYFRYIAEEIDPGEEEWADVRRLYAASVAHADYLLGRALEGIDEETWVILTADHGEHLGEDGLALHQFSLREELVNVPLIVAGPGIAPGRREDVVSHVDLAATVHDIARRNGYETGELPEALPGRSLFADPTEDRTVFAEYGPPVVATNTLINNSDDPPEETVEERFVGLQAAVDREFKLVRTAADGERLYRRGDETEDVGHEHPAVRDRLGAAMDETLSPLPSVGTNALEGYVEQDVEDTLEELGYL